MKRVLAALLLLCAVTMSADAAAQTQMNVYFAANAMDEETAGALMELTRQAFPQAQWRAIGPTGERDLRALILGDDMPDLIVCAPSEASLWVSDGLFIALDGCLTDAPRISEPVLDACVQDETLFMLPLTAKHRQMAVNRRLLEKRRMGYMANTIEHPIWYPMEFDQLLEEFALADHPALEIWPAEPETCGALEALLQALYGGAWMTEGGETGQADHTADTADTANAASHLAGIAPSEHAGVAAGGAGVAARPGAGRPDCAGREQGGSADAFFERGNRPVHGLADGRRAAMRPRIGEKRRRAAHHAVSVLDGLCDPLV